MSTNEQGDSGAGLDAQTEAIKRESAHRRWALVGMYQDVASGSTLDKRPQLEQALQAIERGEAEALVVSKLDRLSRSVLDFGTLLERARGNGWSLVLIDLGVDIATPAGEMVASIMAVLAQWERRMISQRTKDALAAKRRSGTKLGRPSEVPDDVRGMVAALRSAGHGLRATATQLNTLGVLTPRGGPWHASSVKSVLRQVDEA